jgi:hypothetical protein
VARRVRFVQHGAYYSTGQVIGDTAIEAAARESKKGRFKHEVSARPSPFQRFERLRRSIW